MGREGLGEAVQAAHCVLEQGAQSWRAEEEREWAARGQAVPWKVEQEPEVQEARAEHGEARAPGD